MNPLVIIFPLLGAILHPVLGMMIQRAAKDGVGLILMAAMSNLISALLFYLWFGAPSIFPLSSADLAPALVGVLFFFGQWFSIHAIKTGDLAVHSSAMGAKLFVVALLSFFFGLEKISGLIVIATILAIVSVYFVAGATLEGWRRSQKTVWLTLISCLIFGISDYMTAFWAQGYGPVRWLVIMMLGSGLVSVFFLVPRVKTATVYLRQPLIAAMVLGAGFLIGVQALLVNYSLSHFNVPVLINIIFSTRGMMAVILIWLIGRNASGVSIRKKLFGSTLMVVAVALALIS